MVGGKIDNEDHYPKKALEREILEELGVDIEIRDVIAEYELEEKNFNIYFCRYTELPERPMDKDYPNYDFIPISEYNTRNDISPLIYILCGDLIPYIKEGGINLIKKKI